MKRLFLFSLFGLFLFSLNAAEYPNIAVIHTNDDHGMLMGVTGKAAGNIFYQTHPDIFDFLIVYTTFNPQLNMQQGLPIQYTVEGINRSGNTVYGPPSAWGSDGRLLGGARMCNINQYPADPDAPISTNAFSPYAGMTSIELLAHEMGHYWHAAMNFRKEDMSEDHTGLRGWEDGANQHWSGDFMSGPSVMYGGDIEDNGDGTFTYRFDRPKKFGPLDQYVMGLIPPEDVGELFFLCSSENIEECREGNATVPAAKSSDPQTKSDITKHVVTMDDIIRAMGERVPSSNTAQKHFNIAFLLVNKVGVTPFPEQLEKIDAFRRRYEEWFTWATDGRATICTELDGDCENNEDPVADEDTVFPEDDTELSDVDTAPALTDEDTVPADVDNTLPDDSTDLPDDTGETIDDQIAEITDSDNTDSGTTTAVDESGCGCTLIH